MSKKDEYKFQYPIILKQERSKLYKELSYVFACLAIFMVVALIVVIFTVGYQNLPQPFILIPFIAIIAFANLGNCDEVVTLHLSAKGFSINFSNHIRRNQSLEWQEIAEIEPPAIGNDDLIKIIIRHHADPIRGGCKETEIAEFLDIGGTNMYRLLKWHWAKNMRTSDRIQ